MSSAKTAEESSWIAIDPIGGVIQIFRKTIDQEKGDIHVGVSNYSCKPVSQEGSVTILEICHIDGTEEEVSQKDDSEFDPNIKIAS